MVPSKKKVVIGANDLLLAGVQRLVIDQLVQMDRTKFEPHLIVLQEFKGKETFASRVPSDVTVHQLSFSRLLDIPEWLRLIHILREISPDVVKTATFLSNTIFLVLQPIFEYQVIAAEHNTVHRKPFLKRLVDRILFPRAFTVIGDSKAVVDFISQAEGVPKKHLTVLYNGVALKEIQQAKERYLPEQASIRDEIGVPQGAFVFFTAARLVIQKNQKLMIEAFSKLPTKDEYLVIAGGGALEKNLRTLAKEKGLDDRVVFLGEQKEIYRYYSIADAFVLTSSREGFCIAAMEGLAYGLPLISTRVAGVSEYLKDGENGFFVDDTPEDVAEKMERVCTLTEQERASMAERALETAKEYTVERYGREFNQLITDSLKENQ